MPTHHNCEYQRAYFENCDGENEVVAVCRQKCSFNDMSRMIHGLGQELFDDEVMPSVLNDEFDVDRLVDYTDGSGRFVYNVEHDGTGKLYIGDLVEDEKESDSSFELGNRL